MKRLPNSSGSESAAEDHHELSNYMRNRIGVISSLDFELGRKDGLCWVTIYEYQFSLTVLDSETWKIRLAIAEKPAIPKKVKDQISDCLSAIEQEIAESVIAMEVPGLELAELEDRDGEGDYYLAAKKRKEKWSLLAVANITVFLVWCISMAYYFWTR